VEGEIESILKPKKTKKQKKNWFKGEKESIGRINEKRNRIM
jgi:hypothetical protein